MPRVGLRFRWAMLVLAFLDMQIEDGGPGGLAPGAGSRWDRDQGCGACLWGWPLPRGALTKSRKSASG